MNIFLEAPVILVQLPDPLGHELVKQAEATTYFSAAPCQPID